MKPLQHGHKAAPAGKPAPGRDAPLSDAELVRAARRGDKQAFVEIVVRNQAMVCGTALGIVGNIAASEDVAQEAFLIAWRKIHELREPEGLRAWLRQIARHAALGHVRRQRGHDALEETPELRDPSPAPDEQAATEEEAALVQYALMRSPEIYREPLIVADDNDGARGFSSTVLIFVNGGTNAPPPTNNVLPVVNWLRPTNGAALEPFASTLLTANATDADGTINFVEFYAGSNLLGRGTKVPTNSTYNLTWTNPPPGIFLLRAEAVDNANGRGTSVPVQVTVGNIEPVDLGIVEVP